MIGWFGSRGGGESGSPTPESVVLQEKAREVASILSSIRGVKETILIGSALGSAGAQSDADLLVIISDETTRDQVERELFGKIQYNNSIAIGNGPGRVHVLIHTQEEIDHPKNSIMKGMAKARRSGKGL